MLFFSQRISRLINKVLALASLKIFADQVNFRLPCLRCGTTLPFNRISDAKISSKVSGAIILGWKKWLQSREKQILLLQHFKHLLQISLRKA